MFREKRRFERIIIKVPVSVLLLNDKADTILAGPVEGEARNFSPTGFALSLANIMVGRYHIFFTCQENPSNILRIGFRLEDKAATDLHVPARPVWYDRDVEASENRVLLGLEFLMRPQDAVLKKLAKALSAEGRAPASWWKIF